MPKEHDDAPRETITQITPDLFTTIGAAQELGLTPAGLRRAIADGRLKVTYIDRRTPVVSRDEIERYRAENLGRRGRPKKGTDRDKSGGA